MIGLKSGSRILLASLLFLNGAARADDTLPLSYPAVVAEDVKHVLTAPLRWESEDWKKFGLAAAGVVAVGIIADIPVRDAMRRRSRDNRFMRGVERFGSDYAAYTVGGFYLAGVMGNEPAALVAQDGFSASLIASGLIGPSLKFISGRSRPRENTGVADFHPFSTHFGSNSSFPSGHTTEAFTLASVIANHYDATWVTCAAYSVATLVGVARSYHDAHWTSDIVAGALLGTQVGKSVVAHNKTLRAKRFVLLPEFERGVTGLRVVGVF